MKLIVCILFAIISIITISVFISLEIKDRIYSKRNNLKRNKKEDIVDSIFLFAFFLMVLFTNIGLIKM
jgi:hypothetical protein